MATELPAEWQQWLYDNLQRGCAPKELFETLHAHGFAKQLQHTLDQLIQHYPQMQPQFAHMQAWLHPSVAAVAPTGPIIAEHLFASAHHRLEVDGHELWLSMQLNSPAILCFEHFLSESECQALIDLAQDSGRISRSTVVQEQQGDEVIDRRRTSEHTWFARAQTPLLATIEARIAHVLNYPASHGEGLQVLRYQDGGEYRPHFDFFDPTLAGSAKHLAKGGQRVATLILYLSDVEAGGATDFPNIGLTVRPRRGSAVLFANVQANRVEDRNTLHAGLPVIAGCKYIATKWLRERPYGEDQPH